MLAEEDQPVCAFRLKPMSPLVPTAPAIVDDLVLCLVKDDPFDCDTQYLAAGRGMVW